MGEGEGPSLFLVSGLLLGLVSRALSLALVVAVGSSVGGGLVVGPALGHPRGALLAFQAALEALGLGIGLVLRHEILLSGAGPSPRRLSARRRRARDGSSVLTFASKAGGRTVCSPRGANLWV